MSETLTQTPNIKLNKINKVLAPLTAVALVGALGLTLKRNASENPFRTDIPIPAANQPHLDYIVKYGDTENAIASRFGGHYDTLDYDNMINSQLPKADQPDRNLIPGEHLRLPPK